ncbi:membrane transport family protein permease [Chitinispirillum alkaliphilum]|nr:membrane transport family protein permease [Chitinispirillum alkaliphilum]
MSNEIINEEILQVIETIVMLFLVILAGYFLRRIKLFDKHSTERLSRFVVDIALPALIFTTLLESIAPQTVLASWYLPIIGIAILLLGIGVGYLLSPFMGMKKQPGRGSAAFSIGTPNWLFIPLPIATALYGVEGERIVLLVNVGALLVFWTVGVWVVKGGKPDFSSVKQLAKNPGLLATIFGIIAALLFPWARELHQFELAETNILLAALSLIIAAVRFIGDVTIPLSMIVTGSMLAVTGPAVAFKGKVLGVSFLRLIALPLITVLIFYLLQLFGIEVEGMLSLTIIIISAMPVAVTCSIVAEKYNGDEILVSSSIFTTTLISVVTVPVIVYLIDLLGI